MKKLLKELVIPKCEAATSKKEFKHFSGELTAEACKCATEAGIKGDGRDSIVTAFLDRSLGTVYDVHKQAMKKSFFTNDEKESIREKLVLNGRTKATANKILLANSYIDLFVTTCKPTKDHADQTVDGTKKENSTPSANTRTTMKKKEEQIAKADEDTPLHIRRMVSVSGKNTSPIRMQDPDSLIGENVQLKNTILELTKKLCVTKMELDVAKTAQQVAEKRLTDSADVLFQTLKLLGDATEVISKMNLKN